MRAMLRSAVLSAELHLLVRLLLQLNVRKEVEKDLVARANRSDRIDLVVVVGKACAILPTKPTIPPVVAYCSTRRSPQK